MMVLQLSMNWLRFKVLNYGKENISAEKKALVVGHSNIISLESITFSGLGLPDLDSDPDLSVAEVRVVSESGSDSCTAAWPCLFLVCLPFLPLDVDCLVLCLPSWVSLLLDRCFEIWASPRSSLNPSLRAYSLLAACYLQLATRWSVLPQKQPSCLHFACTPKLPKLKISLGTRLEN